MTRIYVAGYEAWCDTCGSGSGVTEKEEAQEWKARHDATNHPKKSQRGA